MCRSVERVRETEKNAVLFSCYLSKTVTRLLFDFIKHAVANCAPFSCTLSCFQDTNICCFFHIRKHMEKYRKYMEKYRKHMEKYRKHMEKYRKHMEKYEKET